MSRKPAASAAVSVRELTPELWPALEKLFGKNGACAGCWCMYWRLEKGERFEDVKGAAAKRRMKALVQRGEAGGALAFLDGEPVGWCALGRRTEFSRLDRAPSLACDDADRVWSLPCFFVKSGYRGRGVATALLEKALEVLASRGARIAEGYPVRPKAPGTKIPAAFAWTGTRSLFDAHGFEVVGNEDGGKQRVRRTLRAKKKR